MKDTDKLYEEIISDLKVSNDPIKGRLSISDTTEFNNLVDFVKSQGLEFAENMKARVEGAKTFYSDLEQNRKRFANGLYGYVGASFAEYSSIEVASDITAEGRNIFKTLDVQTTKLLNNGTVIKDGVEHRMLDMFVDFPTLKKEFTDIVRVDSNPEKIPHLVESTEVRETKKRGNRGLPLVKNLSDTTFHTVVYGDTDSICIGFENICTAYGIDIENDDTSRISRFVEFFCLNFLIPFYHKIIKNLCDKRNCDNYYVLECEQVMSKMHLYAKKCYCSSLMILDGKDVSKDGVVKAGGIVVKKTSYPKKVRDYLKELLNIMLREDQKHNNNIPFLLDKMNEHIVKLRSENVEHLCNTNTVRVFNDYSEMKNGRYVITDGAGVNIKGMCTHNNHIIDNSLSESVLGNGVKVKTYPFIKDNTEQYFSWDIEKSQSPPSWSPKPAMDLLIEKKYTSNAILYITTEYPELLRYEKELYEPSKFPLSVL